MKLKQVPYELSVCKLRSWADIPLEAEFFCVAKTEDELSLVCKTEDVPADTEKRSDGWRGFFIAEELDFSLVGILAKISTLLAGQAISIFAVSTCTTDYILVQEKDFEQALVVLSAYGYRV